VQATLDGAKGNYRVVPVSGAEAERVESEHPHGFAFRFVNRLPAALLRPARPR
jgi:hypothetical protein